MELIEIDTVRSGESPRFREVDEEHVRRLAESEAELPPIVVHRSSMRVIDGVHRLNAARLKGERTIAAEFFDGTDAAAYILGVRANVAHGLPLSLAERKAAARRIVELQPELADRAVARTCGLAASTVGGIRRQALGEGVCGGSRVGHDGRLRPVDGGEGRRRAVAVIRESPGASLREIAQAAGVSLGTAHDIRARLARGEDPLRGAGPAAVPAEAPSSARVQAAVPRTVAAVPRIGAGPAARSARSEPFAGLESLRRDPSLRFTDHGRALLVWLHRRLVVVGEADRELDQIPAHLLPVVAELAQECADSWHRLSVELRGRARRTG